MASEESWLDLELRLLLVGCEEVRRPGLRAARDRARPCVWDRHLAIASAAPVDLEQDVRALDAWYRAGGAMRWSIVVPEGKAAEAWGLGLDPLGFDDSTLLLMEGVPRTGPIREGLRRPGPTDGMALLQRFRANAARARGEDVGALPQQLASALAQRSWLGWSPRVLASAERDEVVSVIVYSVKGERAWMEDLETLEGFRGRGHGRRLLQAALAEIAMAGATRVGFSARESDWPWQWYQRLGFHVVERARRFERVL